MIDMNKEDVVYVQYGIFSDTHTHTHTQAHKKNEILPFVTMAQMAVWIDQA